MGSAIDLSVSRIQKVCKFFGGEEQLDSASLAMADLAARMAVTDAGVHQYLQQEGLRDGGEDPSTASLCEKASSDSAVKELNCMPPWLVRFLWTFSSLKYVPPSKRGARGANLLQSGPQRRTRPCGTS